MKPLQILIATALAMLFIHTASAHDAHPPPGSRAAAPRAAAAAVTAAPTATLSGTPSATENPACGYSPTGCIRHGRTIKGSRAFVDFIDGNLTALQQRDETAYNYVMDNIRAFRETYAPTQYYLAINIRTREAILHRSLIPLYTPLVKFTNGMIHEACHSERYWTFDDSGDRLWTNNLTIEEPTCIAIDVPETERIFGAAAYPYTRWRLLLASNIDNPACQWWNTFPAPACYLQATPTASPTAPATETEPATATETETATATATQTATETATATPTATTTKTATETATVTDTATATKTATETATETATVTDTATATPTATQSCGWDTLGCTRHGISIVGERGFVNAIDTALGNLKFNDQTAYNYVRQHTNWIAATAGSFAAQPDKRMIHIPTASLSEWIKPILFTRSLLHSACHADRWTAGTWTSDKVIEETACITFEADELERIFPTRWRAQTLAQQYRTVLTNIENPACHWWALPDSLAPSWCFYHTATPAAVPTDLPTHTATATATDTPTETQTDAPTETATDTTTATTAATATATDTATATATATNTATDIPTNTPTDVPTATNTATDIPTNTPTDVPTATTVPTAVPTAVPPTPVPTSVPPTAVPVTREIRNLRLSSSGSAITVAWDPPHGETPRDYRLSFVPAAEDWRTWRDSSANTFPTSAGHTISGLTAGVEYKIRLRARYQGDSGPWSQTVRIIVSA